MNENNIKHSSKPTAANSHENSTNIPVIIEERVERLKESSHQIHESSYDTTLRNFESFSKHGHETERSKGETATNSRCRQSKTSFENQVENPVENPGIFERKTPMQTYTSMSNAIKSDSVISDPNYYYGITETSMSGNTLKPKNFESRVLKDIAINGINNPRPPKIDLNYEDRKTPSPNYTTGYYKRITRPKSDLVQMAFNRKNRGEMEMSRYSQNNDSVNEREESIDRNYLENNYTDDSREKHLNVNEIKEISASLRERELENLEKSRREETPNHSDSKIKIEDLNKSGKRLPKMSQVLSKTFFSSDEQHEEEDDYEESLMSNFFTLDNNKQLVIQTTTHFGKFFFFNFF